MTKQDSFDLLIVSDLHAHQSDPREQQAPSYFSTNALYHAPGECPLADLAAIIERSNLRVDCIMTPGDLSDKADPTAQAIAWEHLSRLKRQLKAAHLIGTAGNHDIDSRRVFPEFDPKGSLQKLSPVFPLEYSVGLVDDKILADRFWSRNFVVVPFDEHDCTLLILNSSAFHGYSSDATSPPNEHVRGRVSPITIDAIREEIRKRNCRLNILLLHHHLAKHPWIDDNNSSMIGGDKLIEMLKETGKQWLVIHGHQHVPRLSYADADPFSPVVLSSASVAARTYAVRGTHSRNQVHHISVRLGDMDPSGAELLGVVTSWTWAYSVGWQPARADGGLPYITGFGYRPSAVELRDKLVNAAKQASPAVVRWDRLVSKNVKLKYITFSDLKTILSLVEDAGVVVECDRSDAPRQLEWPQ